MIFLYILGLKFFSLSNKKIFSSKFCRELKNLQYSARCLYRQKNKSAKNLFLPYWPIFLLALTFFNIKIYLIIEWTVLSQITNWFIT